MATIADLEVLAQDRLEEPRDGIGIFWNLKNELRPLLVEAMNEATLIAGLPQVRASAPFTLTANTRFFYLPSGGIVLLRMDGPGTVAKTSSWALDQDKHTWANDIGPVPRKWFPFGIGRFGIYPLLQANVTVYLTTINIPVATARPYTGGESVPFSVEFQEGLVNCAAGVARLKEGGRDAMDGMIFYQSFLDRMVQLSKFGDRIGKLRFTRSSGIPAQVSDVENR